MDSTSPSFMTWALTPTATSATRINQTVKTGILFAGKILFTNFWMEMQSGNSWWEMKILLLPNNEPDRKSNKAFWGKTETKMQEQKSVHIGGIMFDTSNVFFWLIEH